MAVTWVFMAWLLYDGDPASASVISMPDERACVQTQQRWLQQAREWRVRSRLIDNRKPSVSMCCEQICRDTDAMLHKEVKS